MNTNGEHVNVFTKPTDMTDADWYALDFNDPLMMVC